MEGGLLGKIAIFGSTGLLGSFFIRYKNNEYDYKVSRSIKNKYKVDITNKSEVENFLNFYSPDYIINFAALSDVNLCEMQKNYAYQLNVSAVSYLSNWCYSNNSKLIHISTDHLYNSDKYSKEEDINICNYYAESKYLGELEAKKCESIILRTNFFTKENSIRKTFIQEFEEKNNLNLKFPLFNDVYFNPLRIKTLCELINYIIKQKKFINDVFNVGSLNGLSKGSFLKEIISVKKIILQENIYETSIDSFLKNRPKNMLMDVSKFENSYFKLPTLKNEIFNEFGYLN